MLDTNPPAESQYKPTYADILAQLNNIQESLEIAIDKGYPTIKTEGVPDVRMSDKDYLEWALERINCLIYDVENIQEKLAQLLQINCETNCEL
ncbi:hypothetical protein NMW10_02760 [Pasteurella multocida]|uniref:hypothetical protein n=1 Tax=Pasteurella multocida TaxID=747 RepID=UPI0003527FE4|nr:hypothetical protein [Pasteurella multocida]AWB55828.1 hypothetical protein pm9n_09680 [Pasteurella multocida]EPE69319.1 hypothetical protein I142_09895 [Pasteurella multocida RIIF]MCL7770563.1 hypothetical protein [Pasteurella multocida]MCL7804658.1 hypothetical protein [Pasteurella multocida]MCL7815245.1 hypothetical protein [Pasteurella multocida]